MHYEPPAIEARVEISSPVIRAAEFGSGAKTTPVWKWQKDG